MWDGSFGDPLSVTCLWPDMENLMVFYYYNPIS